MHHDRADEPMAGRGAAAAVAPPPFCDLVMKGGITRGIVYPKISSLARR